ncbi:hypothetical protein [Hydrogenoanaerobacterium sp.]|uniref:hypothetical protein n=1 Tax=Hydrogenoanaerobacterium sp. TaxID=2953763 RepID=UPI0028992B33|nr:hypothetical protein [Hydrogenoanaerobacterium sp.]
MNHSTKKGAKAAYLTFILGAVLLVCFRMVLKLDFIDPQTGFYSTHSILDSAFHLIFAGFLLALLIFSYSGHQKFSQEPLPSMKPASATATILGMAIEFKALTDSYKLFTQLTGGEPFKTMDLLLTMVTLLISVVTGVVMIVLAVNMGSDSLKGYSVSAVLVVTVLYQCLMLIERFTSRTSPVTISDDMLEVLMLVFAILFMMAQARIITRINLNKGYRLLEFSGYACALTALVLLIPELFGILIGRLTFEAGRTPEFVYDIALMMYCAVFTRRATR